MVRLRKVIKEEKPNYVMSFGAYENIINIFSCRQNILRIDTYLSSEPMFIYKTLAKIFFRYASEFSCVSKVAAKDLVDNFGVEEKKIKVIYNPSNIKEIIALSQQPLEPQYREIFSHPVVVSIGRFTSQKGQWYLIRAFSRVKNVVKDAKLVIIGGQGDMKEELWQLVLDLDLQKDVHFIGWQVNPFPFLAHAKVFAFSSMWEGFGIVLVEALACQVPIVSADCKAGPREILSPQTDSNANAKDIEYAQYGMLTPAFSGRKYSAHDPLERSEDLFKDAIVKVLTDKKLAQSISKKSLQRAHDFDMSNIMSQWEFLEKSKIYNAKN
jgi:glycosyltransferase involved in cell wall biosynthesis